LYTVFHDSKIHIRVEFNLHDNFITADISIRLLHREICF